MDTYETPGMVTLLTIFDNFDDGILNADRWSAIAAVGGNLPVEENGKLKLTLPAPGNWVNTYADSKAVVNGDFDAYVDYEVNSQSYSNGNNHPANFVVYILAPYHYLWIDIWGTPLTYGTLDVNCCSNNAGGASYKGRLRIQRVGSNYFTYYWNGTDWTKLMSSYNRPVGPTHFRLLSGGPNGNAITRFDNFTVTNITYPSSGTLNLKYDSGRSEVWDKLSFTADTPDGTSIKFRTRTADAESSLSSAVWSDFITASGTAITSPKGRWIEIEATLVTTNTNVTPVLKNVSVTQGRSAGDIFWQTDVPVNLAQGAASQLSNAIGTLADAGKYYLQGTLTSSTGQSISTFEYPFYVVKGNTILTFSPDKKAYKPGEAVAITGEVRNLASVAATAVNLQLLSNSQSLYGSTFDIPANGSYPFTVTTTASTEGAYTLAGKVTQNNSILVEASDQYEVALPKVTASVSAPDIAGNDAFTVNLTLKNEGKVNSSIQYSVVSSQGNTIDSQQITIPVGETKLIQYSQQITADTTYTFTLTGDLSQTLTKVVKYGLGAVIAVSPQAIYPEGKVGVPVSITNNGLLDETVVVNFQLSQQPTIINQQSRTYFIPKNGVTSDTLYFDLKEGNYQLSIQSVNPSASASANIPVRKEIKVNMTMALGTQAGDILPVTVNAANLGYNRINGSVNLSLINADGIAVWNASQEVSLPADPAQTINPFYFNINLSGIKTGNYTVKAELLDTGNRQLAMQSLPFNVLVSNFEITQMPQYQTFTAGSAASMTFRIKNTGNKEGSFDFTFKADDLINSTRTGWLKPLEEKELTFNFMLPSDLEEKDYYASYELKGQWAGVKGQVKYRLAGINLDVTASLDRQNYSTGSTANLTLVITQKNAGTSSNLFARVNYAGFEDKKDFTLNGSQTLTFAIPLSKITGEKLFYGIYSATGRAIHLNALYIYKADGVITVITDKQVYNPGETVVVSVNSQQSGLSGQMTLSGPGGYQETFAFSSSVMKSLTLPASMTAGTYTINCQLTAASGETYSATHPFDVAGIQVKVKEAALDKAKYSSTDNMNLSLTIDSNQSMPAVIKTWVADPVNSYTYTGSSNVTLKSTEPVITSLSSPLSTSFAGIHKLVYGIYQGDLLLSSGSEAFDVGNAVILAVSTDRNDYPETTMPVTVKAELFGTVSAAVEFFLDGSSVSSDSVSLTGFKTYNFTIPAASITPGLHVLKGILTAGGLTSSKEVRFTYGSSLPDLTVQLSSKEVKGATVDLIVTVMNQGKTASGITTVSLYDGDPKKGGIRITTLDVPQLNAGASISLTYTWNLLGKAGEHLIYAVADPDNLINEFNKENNTAFISISFPSLTLSVSTGATSFRANSAVGIAVNLANLNSTAAYRDIVLRYELTNPQGNVTLLKDENISLLSPASETTNVINWNTGSSLPGSYKVTAKLIKGTEILITGSSMFSVEPTTSITGSFTTSKDEIIQGSPLTVNYTITNNGNVEIQGGEAEVELIDKSTGTTAARFSQQFGALIILQNINQSFIMEKVDVSPSDYTVRLTATAAGVSFIIGEKSLKVLPPLEVNTGFSTLPRVLVLTGKKDEEQEETDEGTVYINTTVSQMLNSMGAYYKIVNKMDKFKEELRTGNYNIFILSGEKPLTGQLDAELKERINSGDGLILLDYEKIQDEKFRRLSGVFGNGDLSKQTHTLTLYQSPLSSPGTYQVTGKIQKLTVESEKAQVAGVVEDKGKLYPAVIINPFGTGKTVTFGYVPDPLLLKSAVVYVSPEKVDIIPASTLPVEISLKSFGTGFNLKVIETIEPALPILLTQPLGEVMDKSITWQFDLLSNELKKLLYLIKLPEESGIINLSTSVSYLKNGIYEPLKTYQFPVTADKGLVALKVGILNDLNLLQVTGKNSNKLREITERYEKILNRSVFDRNDVDIVIKELLEVTEDLRKLPADSTVIQLELDKLIKVYERKWVDLKVQ